MQKESTSAVSSQSNGGKQETPKTIAGAANPAHQPKRNHLSTDGKGQSDELFSPRTFSFLHLVLAAIIAASALFHYYKKGGEIDVFFLGALLLVALLPLFTLLKKLSVSGVFEIELREKLEKISDEVSETKQKVKEVETIGITNQALATFGAGNPQSFKNEVVKTALSADSQPSAEFSLEKQLETKKTEIKKRIENGHPDPNKGLFGSNRENNGKKLSVFAASVPSSSSLYQLHIQVSATGANPLTGTVYFFLHPTFAKSQPSISVQDGIASFSVVSYGAFTVGAITEDGTELEYDLSLLPEVDDAWKSR